MTAPDLRSRVDLGVGIGLRAPHYRDFLAARPAVDWLEVHTENYFDHGSWDSHVLDRLRCNYPVSLHGVGLGIGSADGFSRQHLDRIAAVVERVDPILVSEHLCWGAVADRHLNDLLPMPLTAQALALVCDRVDQVQQRLGRQILLENVSTFLRFREDDVGETTFLAAVAARTGCGILLDVNNLYVNQSNHGEDALLAMRAIDGAVIGEVHLGGHLVTPDAVVDHHGAPVAEPVWALYREAIRRFGPVSTLIEWDTDLPSLAALLDEVGRARTARAEVAAERGEGGKGTGPDEGGKGGERDARGERSERSERNQPSDPSDPIERVGRSQSGQYHGKPDDALATAQGSMAAALVDARAVPAVAHLFKGDAVATDQRLALYRGNLFGTVDKVLRAAYPVMLALVGESFFGGLAREYGKAYPSRSGDLNAFGDAFAEFLADFPHVAAYPYFPDMARLEWLVHRATYAPKAEAITAAALAAYGVEQLEAAQCRLHPACRVFASSQAVVTAWLAHQENPGVAMPECMEAPEQALVIRPHWKPLVVPISAAEHAALVALDAGDTLGDALDAALAIDSAFDVTSRLQAWLQNQIFCSITVPARAA